MPKLPADWTWEDEILLSGSGGWAGMESQWGFSDFGHTTGGNKRGPMAGPQVDHFSRCWSGGITT